MDTNSENRKSTADKFFAHFKKAQQEIEELALQLSLGKAEAKDKFEEIKKDLSEKVHHWKTSSIYKDLTSGKNTLTSADEDLLVQLELGKAEAKDAFEIQKKKILESLDKLEEGIKNNPEVEKYNSELREEIEKFRLKI